jgi:hypothetical protein
VLNAHRDFPPVHSHAIMLYMCMYTRASRESFSESNNQVNTTLLSMWSEAKLISHDVQSTHLIAEPATSVRMFRCERVHVQLLSVTVFLCDTFVRGSWA